MLECSSSGRSVGRALFVSLSLLLLGEGARAADVYVLRFSTGTQLTIPPCTYTRWVDQLVFHNTTDAPALVRLLGVSDGPIDPLARDLPIAAQRTVSVVGNDEQAVSGNRLRWTPTSSPLIWVDHLDVPAGIVLSSRGQVATNSGSPCTPSPSLVIYAGFPLPATRILQPAGIPQVHLSTDLGANGLGSAANARVNVGVYNAGTVAATATIASRRGCDDALIAQQTISVPPNSVLQSLRIPSETTGCLSSDVPAYTTYIVVTVDQPSFSYVITASNDYPPIVPINVSLSQ